jgi:hypothetical protein
VTRSFQQPARRVAAACVRAMRAPTPAAGCQLTPNLHVWLPDELRGLSEEPRPFLKKSPFRAGHKIALSSRRLKVAVVSSFRGGACRSFCVITFLRCRRGGAPGEGVGAPRQIE